MKQLLLLAGSVIVLAACNNENTTTSETTTSTDSTNMQSSNDYTAITNYNPSGDVKEETVSYDAGGTEMKSFVAYNEKMQGPRAVVLIVPEWWGLTDYTKKRARMLADMGYLAMAVDMYGDGKTVDNPKDANAAAGPFYQNPNMGKARIDAALAKARTLPQADTSKVAAIGYCFGGSMVLNAATMGTNLDGAVSFHGGLEGIKPKGNLSTPILVLHGESDPMVPQPHVAAFRKSMDSVGANYTFKGYPDATHAFTNPDATEMGKKHNIPVAYNAAADSSSWMEMKAFLGRVLR